MDEEAEEGAEETEVENGGQSGGEARGVDAKSIADAEEYQGEQGCGEHLDEGENAGVHGFGGAVQVGDVSGEEEGAEEGVGVADGEAARGAGAVGEEGDTAEGGDGEDEGAQGGAFLRRNQVMKGTMTTLAAVMKALLDGVVKRRPTVWE